MRYTLFVLLIITGKKKPPQQALLVTDRVQRNGREAAAGGGGDPRGLLGALPLRPHPLRRRGRQRLRAVDHRGDAVRHARVGAREAGVRGEGAQYLQLRPVQREGGLRRLRHHALRRPGEAEAGRRRGVPGQRRRPGGAGAGRHLQLRLEQAVQVPAGLGHRGVLGASWG